ncbi:MAG: CHAP domain-containing protein [Bacteroidia bacterium]|nr:CHAP domain-containing protein [Bacteroidia bacterium]
MKVKIKALIVLCVLLISAYFGWKFIKNINPNPNFEVGQKLDSLNGVYVYYNGGISHIGKRNLGEDGYNIGLSYQCVEFAKRYYYQFYKHKMPDTYGNAKDFFDTDVKDGQLNIKRNLLQFSNPSISKPCVGDLLIFNGHPGNPYGHVAIVSNVNDSLVEIIQQNPGPFASSRATMELKHETTHFKLENDGVLGWLRMK